MSASTITDKKTQRVRLFAKHGLDMCIYYRVNGAISPRFSAPGIPLGRFLTGVALLLSLGCANNVVVEGNFPQPLLDKLPYTIGVYYGPAFRNHEFFDEAGSREETDWLVRTGEAQVRMYNTLLPGMFDKVVMLNEVPQREVDAAAGEQADVVARAAAISGGEVDIAGGQRVDAVLIPHVDELQYSIPSHTGNNVFEIWMRYRYQLYAADGELLADWTMTSYGKTPTAFMQSAAAAVNLAAIVALRDAGANFAINFSKVPEIKMWMDSLPLTKT